MAGPLRRTKLKSSPEEAALFRRHRERGVAALLKGVSRDKLLQEFAEQGVPSLSAERLVSAFEQEAALIAEAGHRKVSGSSFHLIFIVVLIAVIGGILYWAWIR